MFRSLTLPPADRISCHARALLGLLFVLFLSASALVAPGTRAADLAVTPPELTAITLGSTGLIHVSGDGFTPGGRVQIVIVDSWGNALHEPFWTTAAIGGPFGADGLYVSSGSIEAPGTVNLVVKLDATAIYGPHGSQDPANGYHAGVDVGTLQDASAIHVRALDTQSNLWSGLARVNA